MVNRIDELFSPERLRKNWQRPNAQADGLADAERPPSSPMALLEHLQDLIRLQFAGDDATALGMLVDELRALLSRLFQETGDGIDEDPPGQTDLAPAIHETLNRIEDLVEAFEIAGRIRR